VVARLRKVKLEEAQAKGRHDGVVQPAEASLC